MAQHSYRFNPVFRGGAWWRCDVAWRELPTDSHTFIEEWGDGIPYDAGEYVHYSFTAQRMRVTNSDEVLSVDDCEFTFTAHAIIEQLLLPSNFEAEIRLWWSADGTTWEPVFWGDIDLEGVSPETDAIVSGTWLKTYIFTAQDCLRKLNDSQIEPAVMAPFTHLYGRSVGVGGDYQIYWGDRALLDMLVDWIYQEDGSAPPDGLTVQPFDSIIKLTYYLIESANIVFPEHLYESPANGKYLFHSTLGVASLFRLGAYTLNTAPLGDPIEADFYDWWLPYRLIGAGEWTEEWANMGELVAELAEMIGCAVTTKHIIEPGGQWVRQMWYVPRDSSAMYTITPNGLLISHVGPQVSRESKRIVVTSRYPSGGASMPDVGVGRGIEKKLGVHLRTAAVMGLHSYPTFWKEANPDRIRNMVWQLLMIPGAGTRMQVANYATLDSIVKYPSSQGNAFDDAYRPYNGLAHAVAQFYEQKVYNSRHRITETYSRANADSGFADTPAVWAPCAMIGDAEIGGNWRVLEATIDSEKNTVKVVKEKIDG